MFVYFCCAKHFNRINQKIVLENLKKGTFHNKTNTLFATLRIKKKIVYTYLCYGQNYTFWHFIHHPIIKNARGILSNVDFFRKYYFF